MLLAAVADLRYTKSDGASSRSGPTSDIIEKFPPLEKSQLRSDVTPGTVDDRPRDAAPVTLNDLPRLTTRP